MIRVLHLIKSMGRGGAEMLLAEGYRYGDRCRFEYRYAFFVQWKNEMARVLENQGAMVACLEADRALGIALSIRRVSKLIREWDIDIVHCHLPIAGVVGRLASRIGNTPAIYTEHNKMERYHALTRQANISTWNLQKAAIAVSREVKESISRHVASTVPVHVVPNGIDVSHYAMEKVESEPVRRDLGIPSSSPVVGTVAVFREQKRLDEWLRAAAVLVGDHEDVHFLIVGDGPLRDELHALGESLNLSERLHFTGLKRDVRPYLELMDVFVSSSEFEGMPLALLEAMAMGRVVVATDVGGIPEVIRDGENGYLVGVNDHRALAARVSRVLQESENQSPIEAEARRTIEQQFGIARMVRQTEGIYESVIES